MAKKSVPAGRKTAAQKEAYHTAALKRIALDKQIEALKAQKKSLK
jgi:hypothetical protein